MQPIFQNDAIVLALLLGVLALVFLTSNSGSPGWQRFYKYVPALLLCYFLPALLHWPLGLIANEETLPDGSKADFTKLDSVAKDYLLPACLALLCVGVEWPKLAKLGKKALIMFLSGTVGVIIGGPIALLTVTNLAPGLFKDTGPELAKALSTLAGSWIGGAANQAALKEIFSVDSELFATSLVVDTIMASTWMGLLLYGAGISDKIDRWLQADNSAIDRVRQEVEQFRSEIERIPSTKDYFVLLAVAFGCVGLSHWAAGGIVPFLKQHEALLTEWRLGALISNFFWITFLATALGIALSFTRLRNLEGVGASKIASVFIYFLVATIGMQMNLKEILANPGLLAIGVLWMSIHAGVMILVAKLIKAPFFFLATGSMANIGGAASAPAVASAFSPALAPVGVLLAVLGYAIGTYGGIICALLMQAIVS